MKTYWVRFGGGDPRTTSGLSPTFLLFYNNLGSVITPPAISEIAASSGLYSFAWGTSVPMAFLIDGATTGLGSVNRYITGSLDPADRADEYGNTLVAIGNSTYASSVSLSFGISGIGSPTSPIGDSVTDPTTLFGYLKRALEVSEGQQLFTKIAGTWNMLDRTGATTLRTRTITNSASTVIRS